MLYSSYGLRSQVCYFLVAMFMVPALLSAAAAQSGGGVDGTGTGGRHTIQGRIYFPSGRRSDIRVRVKLHTLNAGDLSVFSDSNGSFSFRGLDAGSYTIMIEAGADYESASQSVYIETEGAGSRRGILMTPVGRIYTVEIPLQLKQNARVKAGVVNAMLAAVPASAREHYLKAMDSFEEGNSKKGIEELKAAIAVYAQFTLALNELGEQYLKLGQIDSASETLANAVKSAPEDFLARLNYGIALLNQRKSAEAEGQLRIALAKNSSLATPHLYLGMSLAIQRKLDEAEKELRAAIAINDKEMGQAHRYLAGIYLERHEYHRAADELDAYLKLSPNAADARITRQKIRELRGKG
jgi:Tfp pilus assembly protein PilF